MYLLPLSLSFTDIHLLLCCSDSVAVHNVSQCTLSCPLFLFPPSLWHAFLSPAVLLFFSVTLSRSTTSLSPPVCLATYWKMRKLSRLSAAIFFSIHLCPFHLPALILHRFCPTLSTFSHYFPLFVSAFTFAFDVSILGFKWHFPNAVMHSAVPLFACVCESVGFLGQWLYFIQQTFYCECNRDTVFFTRFNLELMTAAQLGHEVLMATL